jgi:hypothetical protein
VSARPDMCDYLIHFTRGGPAADAFDRFRAVVSECRLEGSSGKVRGAYPCVCFSEAPLPLPDGLVNPESYSRYSPFGVLFEKQWIFDQGGRPVIYQPDAEYDLLPDERKWRHVRYEPPSVDFTWEREWRVQCTELSFDPGIACLVLPSEDYVDALVADHEESQDAKWYPYSTVLDQEQLEQYREDFPWRIISLDG